MFESKYNNGEREVFTYEPIPAESIEKVAEKMIALMNEKKGDVKAIFNDIEIMATEGSTPDMIVHSFEMKLKSDVFMQELPTLDFNNQEQLLDWICKMQEPSDDINVKIDNERVIKVFNEHGYQSIVNLGEEFNIEDKDNFARYLIGQTLRCLERKVPIDQAIHKFTKEWKKRFVS